MLKNNDLKQNTLHSMPVNEKPLIWVLYTFPANSSNLTSMLYLDATSLNFNSGLIPYPLAEIEFERHHKNLSCHLSSTTSEKIRLRGYQPGRTQTRL